MLQSTGRHGTHGELVPPKTLVRRDRELNSDEGQARPGHIYVIHAYPNTATSLMLMATEAMELNGEANRGDSGERTQQSRLSRNRPINMNHYANKKSAAESMLDIALLMANASQLKAVLGLGPSFSFYTPLIALISISLILQIIVGILLIFIETHLGWSEVEPE
ncbi:hypothetical protein DNTS_022321 [Danionella cerebrum]|uniref:Ninjurin 1 n=1 Tax=Danionella cerebrum TaxID=2873325 RepID=A0A553N060_9TELE|nr:hypothetical protein DNTS_022321 [Danionella translucida]